MNYPYSIVERQCLNKKGYEISFNGKVLTFFSGRGKKALNEVKKYIENHKKNKI